MIGRALKFEKKIEKILKIYLSSQNRPKIYENGKKRKVCDFQKITETSIFIQFSKILLKMLGRVLKFEKNNKKIQIKYLRLPNELNFHKNV